MSDQIKVKSASEKRKEIEEGWTRSASKLLQECARAIENSQSMRMSVQVPRNTPGPAVDRVISHLKSLGWKCKRDRGHDQRENLSWDNLIITD